MIKSAIIILLLIIAPASADEIDDIIAFMEVDQTDTHEYFPWYTCGHYALDLARNASEHNLSIGSVILSNHPVFRGRWNSHIVNYVMINDTIVIICPETDGIYALNPALAFDGRTFKYYRLYPDGTQVPTYWIHNLAHTGVIE